MNSDLVSCIGLMSGTSLDGLDLVYVQFNTKDYKQFEIRFAETIKYPFQWEQKLREAINYSSKELKTLDVEYGSYLAKYIQGFIARNEIDSLDFIASHGHTVLHQPEKGITLQIGSGEVMAKLVGVKIVCDFRTQDVQLGGEGAPLVPIGDRLLFSTYDACLNLGGFANISFEESNNRIAFDVCPVNIVLNSIAKKLGCDYDDKGKLASQGEVDEMLLDKLNALKFYQQQAPKSLGLEWVQGQIYPLINNCNLNDISILRTFNEHISIQISKVLKNKSNCLVTGGGVYNEFLISLLKEKTNCNIIVPDPILIDFKEALIFGLLGLLKLQNKINILQSVTGAKKDHSSGRIFSPNIKVK